DRLDGGRELDRQPGGGRTVATVSDREGQHADLAGRDSGGLELDVRRGRRRHGDPSARCRRRRRAGKFVYAFVSSVRWVRARAGPDHRRAVTGRRAGETAPGRAGARGSQMEAAAGGPRRLTESNLTRGTAMQGRPTGVKRGRGAGRASTGAE